MGPGSVKGVIHDHAEAAALARWKRTEEIVVSNVHGHGARDPGGKDLDGGESKADRARGQSVHSY